MRIGLDALLLDRYDSGVEIYIRGLVRALARLDREHEFVVYLARDARPPDVEGNPRFTFRRAPFRGRSRALRILWEQGRLPRALVRDGIDVFHALGYVMPVRSSVPTVVTMHDVIALKHPELCKPSNAAHYRLMLPRAASRAQRIVASSEATKADIVSLLGAPAEKVTVVYPGLDEAFLANDGRDDEVRSKHHLPEQYILFVGNIEPKKNLTALLTAYDFLRTQRAVDMPLVLVGRKAWKYGPVFDAIRSYGMNDRVLLRGYVEREDLPGIYRMAAVFVFPSLVEGFGLPLLEAMASGVPVVASNAPAVPEAVGDAALTVPPDDGLLLGRTVCKVLQNSFLRSRLIERGRERVQRFSWRDTARKMLAVYADLRRAEKA